MASIFTKIIRGEIPCYKVAECEHAIAFLDIRPLSKGHTLVVPKMEVDKLFELPEREFQELWSFAYRVAKAIESVIPCNRVGVAVLGFEVPHAHIHLVPLRTEGDLNFALPKMQLSGECLKEIAQCISNQLKVHD